MDDGAEKVLHPGKPWCRAGRTTARKPEIEPAVLAVFITGAHSARGDRAHDSPHILKLRTCLAKLPNLAQG